MKTKKQSYQIKNWNKYNGALVKRGSLMFWFDEDAITNWPSGTKTGKRGRRRTYTDVAIQCMLTIKAIFHQPLRATEGLLLSLAKLAQLTIPRAIRGKGRKQWKQDTGYHRRSLAETPMFRIKTIFGSVLNARQFESQVTEALIRCNALNRMTWLGMPVSYPIIA